MLMQRTISRSVKFEGTNIFWGTRNAVTFHPARDGHGVAFVVRGKRRIPASLETAFNYRRLSGSCIALRNGRAVAIKVEHVLAALYILGIDNAVVELSDGVCPRLDGSISEFITELSQYLADGVLPKRVLAISDGVPPASCTVSAPDRQDRLTVRRKTGAFLQYTAGYPHKAVGEQRSLIPLTLSGAQAVMHARPIFFLPFGSRLFIDWMGWMHGITDDNALLIGSADRTAYANRTTDDPDEFVKHKMIDALGAVSLLGGFCENVEFSFYRTGHAFDLWALRTLVSRGVLTVARHSRDANGFHEQRSSQHDNERQYV